MQIKGKINTAFLPAIRITCRLGVLIPCLLHVGFCLAQSSRKLEINTLHQDGADITKEFSFSSQVKDSTAALEKISQLLNKLHAKGYLKAYMHDFRVEGEKFIGIINTGSGKFKASIGPGNLPDSMIKTLQLQPVFRENGFNHEQIEKTMDKILNYAENHGHPFATVRLKDINIKENKFKAIFHYQPGLFITFDEIEISGTAKIKKSFLQNFLGIREGTPFNQSVVENIPARLDQLGFLSLTGKPKVAFRNERGEVVLPLAYNNNNQIDGLVSLLPKSGREKGFLLAGHLDMQLRNLFRAGKALDLSWERPARASQQLKVNYYHPRLLKYPVDASVDFQLLKQDTMFLNREGQLNFSFRKGKNAEIAISTGLRASSLLGNFGKEATPYGNFRMNTFGLGYSLARLDHHKFPSNGFSFEIKGDAGKKNIQEVQNNRELSNDWQFTITGNFSQYHKLFRHFILYHHLEGATMHHPKLFLNDLFRMGGFNSLRGFNENAFYASTYVLSNLEFRYVFEKLNYARSYFYVFYDQAYMIRNLQKNPFKDYPLGLGAGLNLITGAGTFNLAYALGKGKGVNLELGEAKIHLGYTARF